MAATVTILKTKPQKLRREAAAHLRASLKEWEAQATGLPPGILDVVYRDLDKQTSSQGKWTFVMISPEQNDFIINYLADTCDRPIIAMRMWSHCFKHLCFDTGEICLRRDEIADHLKVDANYISSVMSDLEKCGAISRHYEKRNGAKGRGFVRYFMNPLVGTHLPGAARDKAQEKAPKLRLVKGGSKARVSCDGHERASGRSHGDAISGTR
jgi:hypothetical protein